MLIRESTSEKISNSGDVAKVLASILNTEDEFEKEKEHLWVLGLNTKNTIKYIELATLGTLNNSLFHPREIFRMAIHRGVASIIVGHNHPSGDLTPSKDDMAMTERLKDAGGILGINVLDSIIVALDGTHYSMKEAGYL